MVTPPNELKILEWNEKPKPSKMELTTLGIEDSFYFHIIYKLHLKTNKKNMINTHMFCHSLEQEPCLGHGICNFGRAFLTFYYYSITLPARSSLPRKKGEKILKEIHQFTKTFRPLRVMRFPVAFSYKCYHQIYSGLADSFLKNMKILTGIG